MNEKQYKNFTEFVVLMGAFGAVFGIVMTGTITVLAIKGNFPWSLVAVVYFVVALGAYAICQMARTHDRKYSINREVEEIWGVK